MTSTIFNVVFLAVLTAFSMHSLSHQEHSAFKHQKNWLTPPPNSQYIGQSHGEIAVSSAGNIYVSVMGKHGGIQMYSPSGTYLGKVPNAPADIHGFILRQEGDKEYIYAARLQGQSILKMQLNGKKIFEINALEAIPKKFHKPPKVNAKKKDERVLKLTAVDVSASGDLYVVDGYGRDFIHRFDAKGQYLSSFGGRQAPWKLKNCHKIAIDPRYQPQRLICADRANGRLVHMKLDGQLIGTYAKDLRRPSAVDFYKDTIAVAEIAGRVSLLDKSGKVVGTLGVNASQEEINHPRTPPEKWRDGVFTSPHGIAFDQRGNLFITEYSNWGRVLKFNVNAAAPATH